MTKPHRNFRLKNKKEAFVLVAFRYDSMESLEYIQRKEPDSITATANRLLKVSPEEGGADVISIRRVYLDDDKPIPVPPKPLVMLNAEPVA
jgi:hypothetical protein